MLATFIVRSSSYGGAGLSSRDRQRDTTAAGALGALLPAYMSEDAEAADK